MMTLWTGSKELHSTYDDKIGPNEEEERPYSKSKLELKSKKVERE